ncbi:haloacid dehalogenase [Bifidobacterium lemurum]|uniref:Haloacid dehalogenase n=1 Tax=Bifidobacterium lemurum TaxID=1603886 RepID=A0A261FRJ7_9BIFI|nr:HAD family hydrolase [Bifidobacterium lemurum]OZG61810.1 haloacid dehalogenase [Bifidobacterium lemurum]QOL34956.1 HAD family hydrolase [Bifidobacterium lemurum]
MLLKAVFWDLDGTLINSEPYWHQGEIAIAHANGGEWDENDGWEGSGTPVPDVARRMIAKGCALTVEQIDRQLKDYVYRAEVERLPWIDGVQEVLRSLKDAGVPSMLVTTSPRRMAENIMAQTDGLFEGYVCGDDPVAHKPDPAPYLTAAARLGIEPEDMPYCVVVEDSMTGIRAGAASGATTIAQTGWIRNDTSMGPQFASIASYEGIDAAALDAFVRQRVA